MPIQKLNQENNLNFVLFNVSVPLMLSLVYLICLKKITNSSEFGSTKINFEQGSFRIYLHEETKTKVELRKLNR